MTTRALSALLLVGTLAIAASSARAQCTCTTLRCLANQYWSRPLVGSEADSGLLGDPTYTSVLASEFDYLTPGNELKWGPIEPAPGQWNFSPGDALVSFATAHGMRVKGHNLVWHMELPAYVNSNMSAQQLWDAMYEHITTEVSHYRGQLYAWDVVNEPVADDGTGTLRKSIFLNKLGPGYITQAFLWARQADPNAELILNEYHNAALTPKSDEVYALAKHLVQSVPGPIGVGIQMHIDATAPPDLSAFAANIQRLRALGVRVNISEMDVKIDDVTGSYATKLARQQVVYHKVVSTCLANGCEAVSFWGFTDAHTWIANDHPCLFDEAYGKKPAYFGVFDAFEGR